MSAPALDLSAFPAGELHLSIANLRATANNTLCLDCRSATLRECREADAACCDGCRHELSADDVRAATAALTEALQQFIGQVLA